MSPTDVTSQARVRLSNLRHIYLTPNLTKLDNFVKLRDKLCDYLDYHYQLSLMVLPSFEIFYILKGMLYI